MKAEAVTLDVTPKFYYLMKKHHLKQVPRIMRPFVAQYFTWLKKLDAGDVLEWMESGPSLKEVYRQRPFAERAAVAGARGFLRYKPRLKRQAEKIINIEIACYTLRFENPLVWEVIQAYGDEGMNKLEQAIEDFKEIMKIKEETD